MLRAHHNHPVLQVIGWKEVIDLPEWGVESLVAKSDTGARSSALDVKKIEELEDGQIAFEIVVDRKNRSLTQRIVTPVWEKTRVKSSNGAIQERYKVRTLMKIGKVRKRVSFSLVSRRRMICRALLGREALGPEFVVHPEDKYLLTRRKRPRISQIHSRQR